MNSLDDSLFIFQNRRLRGNQAQNHFLSFLNLYKGLKSAGTRIIKLQEIRIGMFLHKEFFRYRIIRSLTSIGGMEIAATDMGIYGKVLRAKIQHTIVNIPADFL